MKSLALDSKIFSIFIDNIKGEIIIYQNDNGFSDKDKKAYIQKNKSGDDNKSASVNGFGERLVIDRLMLNNSNNLETNVYSVSKEGYNQKLCLKHNIEENDDTKTPQLSHNDWNNMNDDDLNKFENLRDKIGGTILRSKNEEVS